MGNRPDHVFLYRAHRDSEPLRNALLSNTFDAAEHKNLTRAFRQFAQRGQNGIDRLPALQFPGRPVFLEQIAFDVLLVRFLRVRSLLAQKVPPHVRGRTHQVRFGLFYAVVVAANGQAHEHVLDKVVDIGMPVRTFTEVTSERWSVLPRQRLEPFGSCRCLALLPCGHLGSASRESVDHTD